MQNRFLRTIGASVVLAGVALAATAQVGSRDEPATAEIAVEPTSTTSSTFGANPEDSISDAPFVYRVGVLSGVTTSNFWAFYGGDASIWNSYVHGPTRASMFRIDPQSGDLEAELSSGPRPEPQQGTDVWTVTIPMRHDYQWSDGTTVTANDFVFTFDTVRSLGLGGSWASSYPDDIEAMHAEDDYLLRIDFANRPELSTWPYGVGTAPVMARHVWEPLVGGLDAKELYALEGSQDVASGMTDLEEISDDLVVARRNPGYPTPIEPESVEYHVYADEASLTAGLAAGEVDALLTPRGLTEPSARALAGSENVSLTVSPANGIRYLGFNLERDPMSRLAFRRALSLLIDREEVASSLTTPVDPAWSLLPAANSRWYDADRAAVIRQGSTIADTATWSGALDDLRSAGFEWEDEPTIAGDVLEPGVGLTIDGQTPQPLTILTPGDAYDASRPEYVSRIVETLGFLGFDAREVETDFDTVVDLAFTRGDDGSFHYDMYLLGWTLGNPALPDFYRPLFAKAGAANNTGYSSKTFQRALRTYEGATDQGDALSAVWDMEDALAKDLPYLPLYTARITEAYRSDTVAYGVLGSLGGLQGRLGGLADVERVNQHPAS